MLDLNGNELLQVTGNGDIVFSGDLTDYATQQYVADQVTPI